MLAVFFAFRQKIFEMYSHLFLTQNSRDIVTFKKISHYRIYLGMNNNEQQVKLLITNLTDEQENKRN